MGQIYVVADGSTWPSKEQWKKAMKEAKKRERKQKWEQRKQQVIRWAGDNKDLAIAIGVTVITCVAGGIKFIVVNGRKDRKLQAEQDLKELYCYDRKLGHYWKLRRELSNAEWLSVDSRVKAGERMGDVLESMRVLK